MAFVARALQTLALHSDSYIACLVTHIWEQNLSSCMANWNAEPVAVSPLLFGNISIHQHSRVTPKAAIYMIKSLPEAVVVSAL